MQINSMNEKEINKDEKSYTQGTCAQFPPPKVLVLGSTNAKEFQKKLAMRVVQELKTLN